MRLSLFIFLFASLFASAQQIKIIKNSAPAPTNAIKLTIVPSSAPAGANQVKISLGGGYSLAVDTIPVVSSRTFRLDHPSTVSVGVFDSATGVLKRALWNGAKMDVGTYSLDSVWDYKDDNGATVADAPYIYKVISNQIKYTWEGVIGNTSDTLNGPWIWRGFQGLYDMAVTGNTAYFCLNYAEGWQSNYKVDLAHPQQKTELNAGGATGQQTQYVATDGNIVYWAGFEFVDSVRTFVFGTNVSNDAITTFSSGVSVTQPGSSKVYSSSIGIATGVNCPVTGMAVQVTGSYLFIAHGRSDSIDVLNKTTGAYVRSITSFDNPRGICITGDDKLLVISGTNTVAKYTVNSDGTLSAATLTLSGLLSPLRMSVKPANDSIFVIDGSTNQIVRTFSNTTGGEGNSIGRAGGYQSDPTVYDDKFYVVDRAGYLFYTFSTFIAFQSDGSFWVGDGGNYRVQHFGSNRSYINNIMYYPHSYAAGVDPNNPTRVFNGFMEYQIDYSKSLDNGQNGSWKLVRNWRDGVPNAVGPYDYEYDMSSGILENVITLSNGRTYAFIAGHYNSGYNKIDLFELPPTGNLRKTNFTTPLISFNKVSIAKDGSLRNFNFNGNPASPTPYTFTSKALTGFDGSNNPIWGTSTSVATLTPDVVNDPYAPFIADNTTTGGIIVAFDPSKPPLSTSITNMGYHLGGIKVGDNKWSFRASHSTFAAFAGDFPSDGHFDIGNSVIYPGGNVWVIDSSIFWNYHGENWKKSQTNKWNHYHQSGLLLGQFGITAAETTGNSPAMLAGNSLSGNIVKVNGYYYLYVAEENPHSGLHRWKISDPDSTQVQNVPFVKTGVPHLAFNPYENLMAGIPDTGAVFTSGTAGWTWTTTDAQMTIKAGTTSILPVKSIATTFIKHPATFDIQKDLGVVNSANWVLKGTINMTGHSVSGSDLGENMNLIITDTAGKATLLFKFLRANLNTGTPVDVYVNNVKLYSMDLATWTLMFSKFQPVTITAHTFQLANSAVYSYTPFDAGANVNTPKQFQIHYFNLPASSFSRGMAIAVNDLLLKRKNE